MKRANTRAATSARTWSRATSRSSSAQSTARTHHVSVEHLGRYLAQFDFMYTHCRDTDSARMRRLLGQVGGRRLTYT